MIATEQLYQLQKERAIWAQHNFPDQRPFELVLGVCEEAGELAHHFLKHYQGIRTNEDHIEAMGDAVADCVIFLAGVCQELGLDFGVLVRDTWDVVKSRDWVAFPENGADK